LLVTAGIFIGELLIKNHVEENWPMHGSAKGAKGFLNLRRYHNHGAFLNMGSKRKILMTSVSVGLTAGLSVFYLLTLFQTGDHLLKAGLSLLLGGAFSNTYDRLHRKYVVDYFSFRTGIKALDRVVFNLADFAIMIGALICAVCGSAE
ncbi:MAG: signal peptidase II, partial [Anaerotignum sp.]|nr:signal peptidase II [Anaerotignum sp.]